MGIIEKTKAELIKSIDSRQYEWRIMRVSSLIDLIIVQIGSYCHSNDSMHLQELPSLAVKCLFNFRYGVVDPEVLFSSRARNRDQPKIKERLLEILAEIEEYKSVNKSSLYEIMSYLRQVRELDYSNVIEENLMDIFYKCDNED